MSAAHQQLPRMYHTPPELASPVLPNTLGGVAMQQSVSASSLETTASMQTTCTTPNMSPDMSGMSNIKPGTARNDSAGSASQSSERRLKIEYLLTPEQSASDSFPDSTETTPEKVAASFSPAYTTQLSTLRVADPTVIPMLTASEPGHTEYHSLFSAQSPQPLFQTTTAEDSEVLEAAHTLCNIARDLRGLAFAKNSRSTQKLKQKLKQASHQKGNLPTLKPAHDATGRVTKKTSNTPAGSNANKGKIIAPNASSSSSVFTTPDKAPRTKRRAKSPQEGRNRTAAPSREDKDFRSVPNFLPDVQLAPGEQLEVEWRAVPLDLSEDSLRHLLHEEELKLASSLRLDCATYLTSKRRIFARCVECINNGKVFRKTDAQKACNIDVNKASKLWTAFDKAGWLKESLFAQYKK